MLSFLIATWTVEALLSLPRVNDPQMRPDGSVFAWVQKGIIHTAPIDNPGSPTAIHQGARPRWSPDGNTLAFLASGKVFLHDLGKGTTREFTHLPAAVTNFAWAPDGKSIGFLAIDANPAADPDISGQYTRYSRLYIQAINTSTIRQITTGPEHVVSFALSPTKPEGVYAAQKTPHNQDSLQSDLFRVDLATLKSTPLVVQPGRDGDPSYSPDGKTIAFHSQLGSLDYFGPREIGIIPIAGGRPRYLPNKDDVFRTANVFTWSADSASITYTAGRGVHDVLLKQNIATGQTETLLEEIAGAPSYNADRTRAVYLKPSRAHPPEIALLTGNASRELTKIHEPLKQFPAFATEIVKWKSKDGTEIEGILWLPPGYKTGTKIPLLTELHGGPTGATLDAFPTPSVYPIQAFLANGIAVFSPNFRGSANYGAAFRRKNAKSQGEGDYDDVMTGIDALIARGIADSGRLGVMGWSYGGYLTASVVTQTNRFKAASIGAPATDWITYYGQSDGPKEVLWTYFGGTPWEVPETYMKHSPRFKLKHVRTPCLLQVGALDINHNAEIHRALTDNGVESVYTLYPREGHGFTEHAHIRDVMERNLAWFLRWLKVNPSPKH